MKVRREKISGEEKKLIRRYLIWFYKITKEEFERIERKFTQLEVDYYLLRQLRRAQAASGRKKDFAKKIADFQQYVQNKEIDARRLKFSGKNEKSLHPGYEFLRMKLSAIEDAIAHFLGRRELKEIQALYQQEMIQRILSSREH